MPGYAQATPTVNIRKRQLWETSNGPQATSHSSCPPITLHSDGVLTFGPENIVTLTTDLIFQPVCTNHIPHHHGGGFIGGYDNDDPTPFYASATPQVYVVATATVLAWILVVMLVISPRTVLNNTTAGPSPYSVGRGIIGGAHGGQTSAVGIGSRPWLQKVAALTVAIALTIATADTFVVSKEHYPAGLDGDSMRALVENSLEIRITRIISDIFVWLAQVQTLIRLFPRHKEKVLIKWIGFALIVLDTVFSCLNSFLFNTSPKYDLADAVPALSHIFELALSCAYAAWVIYYSFRKRRYAFYSTAMKTMSLIALLSIVAILTPVVFFVIDITFPALAGWGDYFRWVGAAAASVIVWEWVERIEILERDERKDGILGREIFEGDELSASHPTQDITYNAKRNDSYLPTGHNSPGPGYGGIGHYFAGLRLFPSHQIRRLMNHRRSRIDTSRRSPATQSPGEEKETSSSNLTDGLGSLERNGSEHSSTSPLTPPAPTLSPPNRIDTTSAASTVYVVHHDGSTGPQPVRRRLLTPDVMSTTGQNAHARAAPHALQQSSSKAIEEQKTKSYTSGWRAASNPFKRKRTSPPAEVSAAIRASRDVQRERAHEDESDGDVDSNSASSPRDCGGGKADNVVQGHGLTLRNNPAWNFGGSFRKFSNKRRVETSKPGGSRAPTVRFANTSSFPSVSSKSSARRQEDLPWTIIPAQARGQAWSPGLELQREEPEPGDEPPPSAGGAPATGGSGDGNADADTGSATGPARGGMADVERTAEPGDDRSYSPGTGPSPRRDET